MRNIDDDIFRGMRGVMPKKIKRIGYPIKSKLKELGLSSPLAEIAFSDLRNLIYEAEINVYSQLEISLANAQHT
jgi:hypothetical protein